MEQRLQLAMQALEMQAKFMTEGFETQQRSIESSANSAMNDLKAEFKSIVEPLRADIDQLKSQGSDLSPARWAVSGGEKSPLTA